MPTLYEARRQSPAAAAGDTGCKSRKVDLPRQADVTVNGVPIERGASGLEAQNHLAGTARPAWLSAARSLVVRELLLQENVGARFNETPAKYVASAASRFASRATDEEWLSSSVPSNVPVTPAERC